MTIRTKAQLAG